MNIDELIRQQRRLEEALYGGAATREILRLNEQFKNLGKNWAGQISELSSQKQLLKYVESSSLSSLARTTSTKQLLEQFESSGLHSILNDAAALYGYNAIEQARKTLSEQWGVGSLNKAMEEIQLSAADAVRQFDRFSGVSALQRELESTRKMLLRPEWAALTADTLQAFHANRLDRYSGNSLYAELMRTMEAMEASPELTAEEEAATVFEAIKAYLAKQAGRITPHSFKMVFEIAFTIFFHIYLLHHLNESAERITSEVRANAAKTEQNVNKHATDVAEALWAKIDAEFKELTNKAAESQMIKWAAKNDPVTVRLRPESGSKKLGELLPAQVVVQIDHNGKWVQVEFQDHRAGVPRHGWVLKKRLTRITPHGRQ